MLPLILKTARLNFLIIGFGTIGKRKYNQLIASGVQPTVLTPEAVKEGVKHITGKYDVICLKGFTHVIAATDDETLNHKIVIDCQEKNILCCHVGDVEKSDFFIPSIIRKDDITITINTNGKAPGITKMIKQTLNSMFDDGLSERIRLIGFLRKQFKANQNQSQIEKLYHMSVEELRHEGTKYED